MEIRVYNGFELSGIIENQTSLLWNRKYNDTGKFTLTVPITPRNTKLLSSGKLVWVKGKPEAGIIENIVLIEDSNQGIMQVSGRFLESYISRRLIKPSTNFQGTVEDAMRSFFSSTIDVPEIVLGERHGYAETVDIQIAYKTLLDVEQKLAKSAAYGMRFTPDFDDGIITFDIYKGVDHSRNQTDNPYVIFSKEYANLTSSNYTYNDQLYYNVCYVSGEGVDDTDPQKIYVIAGDDTLTGLERREMYIRGNTASNGLTIAQYRAKLKEEGEIALKSSQIADSFTCMISPNVNFIYKKHYDLGDIITVQKEEWNINQDYRITEINEIYESELPTIEVTLGNPLPEKIEWEV